MTRTIASQLARENKKAALIELDEFESLLGMFKIDRHLLSGSSPRAGANLLPPTNTQGHLSIGLPDGFANGSPFVDDRVFWFPHGLPGKSSIFIGSSRLKQDLVNFDTWFDALRTFACRVNPEVHFLLTAEGISTNRFVKRISELFDIPICEFRPLPQAQRCKDLKGGCTKENICFFSHCREQKTAAKNKQGDLDRLLILAAERVRLLSVRGNGNTARAVQERIEHNLDTRVLVDHKLTPRKKLDHLLAQGVAGWCLFEPPQTTRPKSNKLNKFSTPILKLDEIECEDYLLHWTRRRVGKWPHQSETQHLDDLIFGSTRANHEPLAALCRILASERIMAFNDLTRGQQPVVCLTEVGLKNLAKSEIFRPHLARWDGLPFGIAIQRDLLLKHGARKVIYGDESTWRSLEDDLKPFFQVARSRSGSIDWRVEREWRMVGDLDLRQIGNRAAFVFVPTIEAAETISRLSRWPIVVLSEK